MEKDFKVEIKNFMENLAKEISNATGVPVYIMSGDSQDKIFELLKNDEVILKNFNENDLRREISDFLGSLLFMRPKNENELSERLNEFISDLKKEKIYKAVILLNGIRNLPIGMKLGNLEVIGKYEYDNEDIKEHFERLEKERKIYPNIDSWAKVEFKTYINFDPSKILFQELELPFAILSFISSLDLDSTNVAGIIFLSENIRQFLSPYKEYDGWSIYNEKIFKRCLDNISEITVLPSKNPLQMKILQAIRIFGLSRLSRRVEIRFLMIISAMESLLLTKEDRDYIGMKLAQKTTVLLGNNCKDFNERRRLYKRIKKLYNKRSDLIHKGEVNINDSDEREIENYFINLILKVTELSKVYKKFDVKEENNPSGEEGLDDFIDNKIFGEPY